MCGGRDVKENVCVESERWIERMTLCSWGEKGEVCEAARKKWQMRLCKSLADVQKCLSTDLEVGHCNVSNNIINRCHLPQQ